jgi:two-component system sensor histidine kinase RegB
VAAVTTLAAGAAHELGTPLATIAVASHELERAVLALPDAHRPGLLDDAGLIRAEVERCRGILARLAADAGQRLGEAPREVRLGDLLDAARLGLPALHRPRVRVTLSEREASVTLPQAALLQVIDNLLRNALEAGPGPVEVTLARSPDGLRIEIRDHAGGMPAEVLARVGEPFFSTKPPGSGLGLGVFIARSLCEQMGGRLKLTSTAGAGTSAVIEIAAGRAGAPRAA